MKLKRILFLSWRDIRNPKAGGAENFTHQLMLRLVKKGYEVHHFSCGFKGSQTIETLDGITYHCGANNIIGSIVGARKFYKTSGPWDWVIDQRNTHHAFSAFWLPKHQPRALFIHQTTRELWFSEMLFPVTLIGRIHESITLRSTNKYPTFTASQSTADELIQDYGYKPDRCLAFHQGLNVAAPPLSSLPQKFQDPTFIYVGRFSRYKGIDAAILAFRLFYQKYHKGKLIIVGKKNSNFDKTIWQPLVKKYPELETLVRFTGFVSVEERDSLMAKSHAILVPSQREGWGIIVTEANVQNTPAIVYPSPGLTEAVSYGETGLITKEKNPESLFESMVYFWENPEKRKAITQKARTWAETFNWDIAADQADKFFNNEVFLNLYKVKNKDPE